MRIWSLHPKYLDTKGLVSLWRETLLAKNVLECKTKGYKNHPQLERFKKSGKPVDAINQFLIAVYSEALQRRFNFNKEKINCEFRPCRITVTNGQLDYEAGHLLNKLQTRDPNKYKELKRIKFFEPHPLFEIVEGPMEKWEKATAKKNR